MYDLFHQPPAPAPAPPHKLVGRIPLRWCQRQDCDALMAAIESGKKHPCAIGATGYGKGPMIAEMVGRLLPNGKVLIVINRAHLVHQLSEEIERHLGITVGRVADGVMLGINRSVVVATVQAMYSQDAAGRPLYTYSQFADVKSVIGDEAHTLFADTFRSVPAYFVEQCSAIVVLFTATPVPANGSKWESFVDWTPAAEGPCMRTAGWCIRNGYLVPPRQAFVRSNLDLSAIHSRLLSTATDDDNEDAGDEVAEVLGALLDEKNERDAAAFAAGIAEVIGDRQTIIFSPPRVAITKSLASWLTATGKVKCEPVWGARVDKSEVLAQFVKGTPQALSSVNLLCEGYNNPFCSAVFICRLLNNWRLIQQMVGRALRPHPSIIAMLNQLDGPDQAAERVAVIAGSPKPNALVADLVGIDGHIMQASAIDVLYDGESDDVKAELGERAFKRQQQSKPQEPGDAPDKAELEAAKSQVLQRQHEQLANLARRRAMAGKLPAEVRVTYGSGSAPSVPSIPNANVGATIGEKARFVAIALKYDPERAKSIADSRSRAQLRGMTAAMQRDLMKSGQRPDWSRARKAYPEWANQKAGAA